MMTKRKKHKNLQQHNNKNKQKIIKETMISFINQKHWDKHKSTKRVTNK